MLNFIKNREEIQKMRIAGDVVAKILATLYGMIVAGNNGLILANKAFQIMKDHGCEPNFLNYQGFKDVICVSINHELIHGIPDKRLFQDGDLVSIDVGCKYQGMHADAALTKIVGKGTTSDQKLVTVTKQSLDVVISQISAGNFVGDIGYMISSFVWIHDFFLTNNFSGHGIGKQLHEEPSIFNIDQPKNGIILQPNMVICVEPMVLTGDEKIKILKDGWTVVSQNGQNNCHFEHMLLITENGCEVLTDYKKYLL